MSFHVEVTWTPLPREPRASGNVLRSLALHTPFLVETQQQHSATQTPTILDTKRRTVLPALLALSPMLEAPVLLTAVSTLSAYVHMLQAAHTHAMTSIGVIYVTFQDIRCHTNVPACALNDHGSCV